MAHVNVLIQQHLASADKFDMWVIALTPSCAYVLFRVIMWCRFGYSVGLLHAKAVWRRSHHKWILNLPKMAAHLAGCYGMGLWPMNNTPIILAHVGKSDMRKLKVLLAALDVPHDERARLRGVPYSLSSNHAVGGFNGEEFVASPGLQKWRRIALVKRTKRTRRVAGKRARRRNPPSSGG